MNQRIALVTGATQGIGFEFCRALGEKGWTVVMTGRDQRAGEEASRQLAGLGYSVIFQQLAVQDEDQVRGAREAVAARFNHLDLLINNAGVNPAHKDFTFEANADLDKIDQDQLLEMVRINAVGSLLMIKHFRKLLTASSDPRILNVSSWMGSIGNRKKGGNYSYCVSKAALNMISKLAGFDLREDKIICLAVNPGSVRTRMGGDKGQFSPQESVSRMLGILQRSTIEDSGKFFNYDGEVHEW
ncbi:MAG: SDR family oxidoreductase [Oligoflexia bacterium]|nr:SDR family oxidoreductase [Oligoflexia bacterium]